MYLPTNNQAERFYDNREMQLPVITSENGSPTRVKLVTVPPMRGGASVGNEIPDAMKPQLSTNIERLYKSVAPYEAEVDGHDYSFEIGYLEGSDGDDTELRVSTVTSSLTGNYGNGFEIARLAAYNPQRTYVYVASPGNGMSSRLSAKEMRYFARYGSLLHKDNESLTPLPIVQALGKVMVQEGFSPTRLGSDSAGAILTTAFGASYGKDTIRTSHQNVRPNIYDISPAALIKGMRVVDTKISEMQTKTSRDALRVRPEILSFTREQTPRTFSYWPSPAMVVTNLFGLGRGPRHGDPLVHDNQALVRNNEGIHVLFTVGRDDPLMQGQHPTQNARMIEIVQQVTEGGRGTASAVMLERMSHGIQTHYPQLLQAIGRTILG